MESASRINELRNSPARLNTSSSGAPRNPETSCPLGIRFNNDIPELAEDVRLAQ
jgi:hypothetical protein